MEINNTIKNSKPYRTIRSWKDTILLYFQVLSKHYFKYSFVNLKEFLYIYHEIFIWDEYKFITKKKDPIILDCGSHIGLSVLYFKKKYPGARITVFEPNPRTFKILQKNIEQNKIDNVVQINAALADSERTIPFYVADNKSGHWNWSDSGIKHHEYSAKHYKTIYVPTLKLSSFINGPIDFLKIDVEWMEFEVLKEIEKKLYLVKEIAFDFHGSQDNPVERLLKILRRNNFSYLIYQGEMVTEKEIEKTKPAYSLIIRARNEKFKNI